MTDEKVLMTQKGSENLWVCKKCGILRSSKFTHKHGEKLPEWKLKVIAKQLGVDKYAKEGD